MGSEVIGHSPIIVPALPILNNPEWRQDLAVLPFGSLGLPCPDPRFQAGALPLASLDRGLIHGSVHQVATPVFRKEIITEWSRPNIRISGLDARGDAGVKPPAYGQALWI
jgi:hypothetical protein